VSANPGLVEEKQMKTLNQNLQYILAAALAVFLSSLFHELAHWVTGELLGNRMAMNLNAAFPVSGDYMQPWHAHIVTAAGPIFTVLQGFVVYLLMQKYKNKFLYLFLLTPLIMRTLALFMNFLTPNDEGRISLALGLGLLTVPIVVCLILFLLTWKVSRQNGYSVRFNAVSTMLVIFFLSVVILSTQYLSG
jgi:hypothetical protein